MSASDHLLTVREALETVDRELLDLLRRRQDLAEQVLEAKLRAGAPLRDLEREASVRRRILQAAEERGLDPIEAERLFRVLFEMAVVRQQARLAVLAPAALKVAYQGVEGSYSHLAARERYTGRAGGALLTGHETVRAAAEAVRSGAADLALLPIENTTAGSINETYDLLSEGGLAITAEVVCPIEHCLLVLPGTRLEDLHTVVSHPQALLQCAEFLRSIPWARQQAEFDTAGAARKVRDGGDPAVAAIASRPAARVFGLEVLRDAIQSQASNSTRFVELAREPRPAPPEAACKTSLVLVLAHQPGALGRVLARFGDEGINLVKLESRPIPTTPFRYRFYLDVEGDANAEPLRSLLTELAPQLDELRVLGTYPVASRPGAEEAEGRLPSSG